MVFLQFVEVVGSSADVVNECARLKLMAVRLSSSSGDDGAIM